MAKPMTPPQIRDAELPRALRGFDVEATRSLLADAAGALTAITRERDDLRKQVDELSELASRNPTDAERLGGVLLIAKRAADDLLAKAKGEAAEIRAEAEQLHAETERQRAGLVAEARAQAEATVREASRLVESLGRDADELRRSLSLHREEFAAFLRSALKQLENIESLRPALSERPPLDGELLAQLPSE